MHGRECTPVHVKPGELFKLSVISDIDRNLGKSLEQWLNTGQPLLQEQDRAWLMASAQRALNDFG
jgi:hypothetical protein